MVCNAPKGAVGPTQGNAVLERRKKVCHNKQASYFLKLSFISATPASFKGSSVELEMKAFIDLTKKFQCEDETTVEVPT